MSVRKDLKEVKKLVEEIHSQYATAFKKARLYDEQKELLKHIKFVVKDCQTVFNENTLAYSVVVRYELPKVQVDFEVGGEQMQNDRLRAINLLDLISAEDMEKIRKKLQEAEKLTKGE